jgi:hypothetical protein
VSPWEWLRLPARWCALMTAARRAALAEIAAERSTTTQGNRAAALASQQARRTGYGRIG